jgi:hypothetical protein
MRDGVLYFAPRLIDRLDGLSFSMQFRGTPIRLRLAGGRLDVAVNSEGTCLPVAIGIGDEVHELARGESCSFALAEAPARR